MWPHCRHGADPATDPVGCRGIHVPGYTACLAHLAGTDRDAYLASLVPSADIDHRGTPFTESLLSSLLRALHDPAAGQPHFGTAWFDEAQFSGDAWFAHARFAGVAGFTHAHFCGDTGFDRVQFSDAVRFEEARFSGIAGFTGAQFSGAARFDGARFADGALFTRAEFSHTAGFGRAQFSNDARFDGTHFSGDAWFAQAQFSGAWFDAARFSGDAWFIHGKFSRTAGFIRAKFSGDTWFEGAQFSDIARFTGAQFTAASWLGPVVCMKEVDLSGALFEVPVTLQIAARMVRCGRTRWDSTATLFIRYARVDLSYAVLSCPVAISAYPTPFTSGDPAPSISGGRVVDESMLAGSENRVRVVSVGGVDAANLALTDTDLSECRFAGAFHLDQIRLEGSCTFASTPTGLHRRGIWPYKWTRRRVLAEEHHWRAQTAGLTLQAPSFQHWRIGHHTPSSVLPPAPEAMAALYRQLRKAFEDGKNEPGAADFYYGEMEMRRHDRGGTSRAERGLLHGYWLLSGYGLRASRALGWLAVAMLVTIMLLMGFGLPNDNSKQEATGTVPPGGGQVTFEIGKDDPHNPTGNRFTGERFEKALNVTLNSVVFRSADQDLTTAGTYIEMTSRLAEPVLLGLAVLAVRNRVKR
ncbi:pentapeptide repeat-containing protein [Streptomyces canus]